MKLAMVPAALLNIVLHATYYAACHTGSLDRIFASQTDLSAVELTSRYGRRAKVVAAVCWLLVVWNMSHYVYQLFTNGRLNDLTVVMLEKARSAARSHIL